MEHHVELWNAGDKEAWLSHIKQASPGGLTMEDPVGTPIKHGHDIMNEVWDLAHSGRESWTLSIDHLVICGHELAMVINNEGIIQGTPVVVRSIETYRFDDDGSLLIRTYHDIPAGSAYGEWTATTGS
jgi:hypothetical protein